MKKLRTFDKNLTEQKIKKCGKWYKTLTEKQKDMIFKKAEPLMKIMLAERLQYDREGSKRFVAQAGELKEIKHPSRKKHNKR